VTMAVLIWAFQCVVRHGPF